MRLAGVALAAALLAACNRGPAPAAPTNTIPGLIADAIAKLDGGNADAFVDACLDPERLATLAAGERPRLKQDVATRRETYLGLLREAAGLPLKVDAAGDRAAVTGRAGTLVFVRRGNTWYIGDMMIEPAARARLRASA